MSPAEVMQMHRSRFSLLLLAAVMAMTDKHIIAITCWLCDPCQEPSTWKTCHGDMCHNITDKHRRGTPDTRSFRQKLRQKNQWDLFYRVHIKKVPLIFFAVTFTNIDGFSYFFRVSLQHGDRVTCTMCRCPILLKNVVIPENRADKGVALRSAPVACATAAEHSLTGVYSDTTQLNSTQLNSTQVKGPFMTS